MNNEEDDIIVLTPDDVEEEGFSSDEEPISRPSRKALLFLGLGILLGGGLVGGLAWYLKPAPYDPAPLQSEITALQAEIETLKARPDPVIPRVDLGPINRRLTALENQPEAEPIDEALVARLEALKGDGFEWPELPNFTLFESRLSTLEADVETLQTAPPITLAPEVEVEAEPYFDPASLPRFPEQVLRDGIAEMAGTGFARRLLSRHVRVQGDDRPEQLIDDIVSQIEVGRADKALEIFDTLPPELASLARGWRADMEDALETRTP